MNEIIFPLLKSLQDDLERLGKQHEMIAKVIPSGKMVSTEMTQLFSKIKDGFTCLSSDLKRLIEQLNYAHNVMTSVSREDL